MNKRMQKDKSDAETSQIFSQFEDKAIKLYIINKVGEAVDEDMLAQITDYIKLTRMGIDSDNVRLYHDFEDLNPNKKV